MQLFLLRHADAEAAWPDADRRLTTYGKNTLDQLCDTVSAKAFKQLAHIWHSPYVRATETALHLKQGLGLQPELEVKDGLTPEDKALECVGAINELRGALLIVGHNPHLTVLAGYLLCENSCPDLLHIQKAGLICLERVSPPRNHLPAGAWALNWYITPPSIA